MGVVEYPSLLLKEDGPQGQVKVYNSKMKLPDLIEFVLPYALPDENSKQERTLDS